MQHILVDWGTSSLRVYRADGSVFEQAGRGVLSVPPAGFSAALEDALTEAGVTSTFAPAIICGMASSSRGWRDVPYACAPAALEDVARGTQSFKSDAGRTVVLVPGVRIALNAFGQPDVMRGEETQIFGAADAVMRADGGDDDALFLLPGTHSKWASVSRRRGCVRVESFQTAMTGELYALLSSKSCILSSSISVAALAPSAAPAASDEAALSAEASAASTRTCASASSAFLAGAASAAPLHALFSLRARDVCAEEVDRPRVRVENAEFLSGALIALELREAAAWVARWWAEARSCAAAARPTVHMIGAPALSARDSAAITAAGWADTRAPCWP